MTTDTPPSPALMQKALLIARCVGIIARATGIPAAKIICKTAHHGAKLQEARSYLVYHLHDCGMSLAAIGRVIMRSETNARRLESYRSIRINDDDRALLASLPAIPVTLKITKTTDA